jgi:hypothetical protein
MTFEWHSVSDPFVICYCYRKLVGTATYYFLVIYKGVHRRAKLIVPSLANPKKSGSPPKPCGDLRFATKRCESLQKPIPAIRWQYIVKEGREQEF